MRRFIRAFVAAISIVVIAGCNPNKDFSKENITPAGQPDPGLQAISPAGTGQSPAAPSATAQPESK